MKNKTHLQPLSFQGLGIAPALLDVLEKLRYANPTPIQHQSIPIAIEGKDLVGIAQTGTGKTLAFGVPMIQNIARLKAQGLVLVPTRELAIQAEEQLRTVGQPIGLRTAVLIGGQSPRPQLEMLRKNPHVIIATPGRLNDYLEQKILNLERVKILVLDEADRMLDMGFLPQIKKILHRVPRERQTMLFSATLSSDIMAIATATMKLPIRVEISSSGTTPERVVQEIFVVKKEAKGRLLEKVLSDHAGSALVFTRTKYGAKRTAKLARLMGHTAAEIHSNRSLSQRKDALLGFKTGKYRVLVATDIAARGIDVAGIELVVNYDLPLHAEDYVHRIGRTGRAGAEGHAVSFMLPEERYGLRAIERLIRKSISVLPLPELPPERVQHGQAERHERHFQGARHPAPSHHGFRHRRRFRR